MSKSVFNPFRQQGLVGTNDEGDCVCNTYYKSHLVTIKHVTNSVDYSDFSFSDKEVCYWRCISLEQLMKYSCIHTIRNRDLCGEMLSTQDALLLPDIYEISKIKWIN